MAEKNNTFEIGFTFPIVNAVFDDIEHQVLVPLSCLRETGNEWFLEIDLPMVDKKDITVSLDDENTIAVQAKLKETFCDVTSINKNEFNFFKKSITLPGKINSKKISAKFEQGRLIIRVPKLQAGTKISIE